MNYNRQDSNNLNATQSSSTLKDFEILSKLGEGSFSQVFQVRRKGDDQIYAMKKVKMAMLKEKERENALNEVRILASIQSDFIVGYKDAFIDDPSQLLCVVMEFASGGDLQAKIQENIKNKTFFPETEIWKALTHMASGLQTLHSMKILHRDLKCANVFLSADGIYKLGDMNVSKVAKKGLVYTQTGTPYYASPEVWRDQPYDIKSDIWSLGCVLYEMCTLHPPFRAKDMDGLFKKVQKGEFDRIPNTYSNELQSILEGLLRVSPPQRPSCEQILNNPIVQRMNINDAKGMDILSNNKRKNNNNSNNEGNSELLNTIVLPKNLNQLKGKLPKANYYKKPASIDDIQHNYQQDQNKDDDIKVQQPYQKVNRIVSAGYKRSEQLQNNLYKYNNNNNSNSNSNRCLLRNPLPEISINPKQSAQEKITNPDEQVLSQPNKILNTRNVKIEGLGMPKTDSKRSLLYGINGVNPNSNNQNKIYQQDSLIYGIQGNNISNNNNNKVNPIGKQQQDQSEQRPKSGNPNKEPVGVQRPSVVQNGQNLDDQIYQNPRDKQNIVDIQKEDKIILPSQQQLIKPRPRVLGRPISGVLPSSVNRIGQNNNGLGQNGVILSPIKQTIPRVLSSRPLLRDNNINHIGLQQQYQQQEQLRQNGGSGNDIFDKKSPLLVKPQSDQVLRRNNNNRDILDAGNINKNKNNYDILNNDSSSSNNNNNNINGSGVNNNNNQQKGVNRGLLENNLNRVNVGIAQGESNKVIDYQSKNIMKNNNQNNNIIASNPSQNNSNLNINNNNSNNNGNYISPGGNRPLSSIISQRNEARQNALTPQQYLMQHNDLNSKYSQQSNNNYNYNQYTYSNNNNRINSANGVGNELQSKIIAKERALLGLGNPISAGVGQNQSNNINNQHPISLVEKYSQNNNNNLGNGIGRSNQDSNIPNNRLSHNNNDYRSEVSNSLNHPYSANQHQQQYNQYPNYNNNNQQPQQYKQNNGYSIDGNNNLEISNTRALNGLGRISSEQNVLHYSKPVRIQSSKVYSSNYNSNNTNNVNGMNNNILSNNNRNIISKDYNYDIYSRDTRTPPQPNIRNIGDIQQQQQQKVYNPTDYVSSRNLQPLASNVIGNGINQQQQQQHLRHPFIQQQQPPMLPSKNVPRWWNQN